jgi:3-oxoacyl-[acyl-carrier protein] reductase
MDLRAMGAERLCNAVADPAGAADHQNPLAAKIQFVHRQPRIWFYAENITANIPGKKRMSDFKQLSRSVRGLTVLVTGAASGMGRATARVFAAEGANVAVTDHAAEGAKTVAAEITAEGEVAKAWTLDVADRDQITAVVSDVAAHFGGLDIIVNNAGMSVHTKIDEEGYEEAWAKALAVMLTAHPRVIRAAPPHLRKSKSPRIVNIASTEALGATAELSPYSAAKAGVVGLTRSLAVELGREGITVNCICPGPITTAITARIPDEHKEIYAKRRTALRRYGDPEEVAHMTLSLCLPAASFLTGAVIPVDGGLMARNA